MTQVCFYFQVHQPYRLKPYTFDKIGADHSYFHQGLNQEILRKVAEKCYIPTNYLLAELLNKHKGKFKVAFSVSGMALAQFQQYDPLVLASFKALAATGHVEFLGETYYHSLSSQYATQEFIRQVEMHKRAISKHFGQKPTVFRNTELIYSQELVATIKELGFKGIVTEGVEGILGKRSPNHVYWSHPKNGLPLLLKNFQLSDDIAFRFSETAWPAYPLTPQKFLSWLVGEPSDETINLFMDYETFGEHHARGTGIFDFLAQLPGLVIRKKELTFATPSEVLAATKPIDVYAVPEPISWADQERDLSAWTGNAMQKEALQAVYSLENRVKRLKKRNLFDLWGKLQTSDHFYYMSTKAHQDGHVHQYFSPYPSPYDAYINYMNVLADFKKVLAPSRQSRPPKSLKEQLQRE